MGFLWPQEFRDGDFVPTGDDWRLVHFKVTKVFSEAENVKKGENIKMVKRLIEGKRIYH